MVRPKAEDPRVHTTMVRWNDEERAVLEGALKVWASEEGKALGGSVSAPVLLRALLFRYAGEKGIRPGKSPARKGAKR